MAHACRRQVIRRDDTAVLCRLQTVERGCTVQVVPCVVWGRNPFGASISQQFLRVCRYVGIAADITAGNHDRNLCFKQLFQPVDQRLVVNRIPGRITALRPHDDIDQPVLRRDRERLFECCARTAFERQAVRQQGCAVPHCVVECIAGDTSSGRFRGRSSPTGPVVILERGQGVESPAEGRRSPGPGYRARRDRLPDRVPVFSRFRLFSMPAGRHA